MLVVLFYSAFCEAVDHGTFYRRRWKPCRQLEACLKSLRKGDTLVVWRLDRLGRSLGDLIDLTTELRSRGVDFESLTEKIETGSSTGKLIFHVFASLAEFERNPLARSPFSFPKASPALIGWIPRLLWWSVPNKVRTPTSVSGTCHMSKMVPRNLAWGMAAGKES